MENPKIRFKGFTKDWEQRKLGDMGSTYTGLSGKTKEDFGHGDAKFITYMNVFSNPVANLDMTESVEIDSKQNCVKAGDVFFTTSSETPEEVGMSSVMPENADNIYLNSFCFGYRPTEKFDLNYLAYVLRTESFRKEMTFLAQGISRYNISKNKVMEVEIPIPSLDEQSRVGQYFKNLDTLITLHQRKCEQTKNLKKYMLQKMFPQNGAKVPEIRFNGFTHDWEQRKFSDIASRESVSRESSYDLPSLEYEDVIAEEGRLNKDISLKENIKKGIVFDGSQVLYGKLRPYLHNWLNPDFSGVAVGDWWVLKPNNADKSFIYRLIQTQRFDDIANQSAGSKMPRADWNLVSNTEFAIPVSQEEQEKIGEYFSSLDHLITLHQRQHKLHLNMLL